MADDDIGPHGPMMKMVQAVEENLWPVLFIRVPPEDMALFERMTANVQGDMAAKFHQLMVDAEWVAE